MALETGFLGESRETEALERNDLAKDGVFARTRSQMCEAEIVRDEPYNWDQAEVIGGKVLVPGRDGKFEYADRANLMNAAAVAPAIMSGCAITPLDDRLIVRYASFREGYVCTVCDGTGESSLQCLNCLGYKKVAPKPGWDLEDCKFCRVVGADSMEPRSSGMVPCPGCNGSGLKNSAIAIPDASKQDHSYGDVVSCGAQVYDLRNGDRVIFSKMAGVYMKSGEQDKYGKDINYCLLRRGEVMGLMVKK